MRESLVSGTLVDAFVLAATVHANDCRKGTTIPYISHFLGVCSMVLADGGDEQESIPARNKLRADIQKTLLQPEFSKLPGLIKNRARVISRLMEIAEKNNDTILYAP
jgi:hypothetical protein